MKDIFPNTWRRVALYLFAGLYLMGCTMEDQSSNVSTDIVKLQELVIFDFIPTSVKWEVFGTPEYTGGLPGPTDYVTLIAEFPSIQQTVFANMPAAAEIWIAPESGRKWLSDPFRLLLEMQKNVTTDFSTNPDCRSISATLRRTRERVNGLACIQAGKLMVYLTIADYSTS
jgi:hypothetical protein